MQPFFSVVCPSLMGPHPLSQGRLSQVYEEDMSVCECSVVAAMCILVILGCWDGKTE